MNLYAKPFKSYADLQALLAARGLVMPDPAGAQRTLTMIGYYRLSGYWYPFRSPAPGGGRTSTLQPGTTLDQVLALYEMDRRLKLLTLDAIERVEIAMRVRLGHTLGARDPFAHEMPAHLDGLFLRPGRNGSPSKHNKWLDMVSKAKDRSTEDFVQHFDLRYGGRLPIWALTEIMDFGSLSHLYSGAQRRDRDAIAMSFGVVDAGGQGNGLALANWMRVLNYLRNTCAHHSRLWNRNMTVQVAPSHLRPITDLAHVAQPSGPTVNRVYGALTVLSYLMRQIGDGTTWCADVRSTIAVGMADSGRTDTEMGCPKNWHSEQVWS
ncbi:Abi family protein [Pedococcus soli]